MELLKGKPVAESVKEKTAKEVMELIEKDIVPTLGILRVGDDESDIAYEKSAQTVAKAIGVHVEKYIMPPEATQDDVLDVLKVMNEDQNIHGILILRPLPKHIDEDNIRNHIDPAKDIDGISDRALSGLFTGERTGFPPCTAEASMLMLDYYGIELAGKKALVMGRSLVIGKPVAMLLMEANATVSICHSQTSPTALKELAGNADIIVCATGKAGSLTKDHVSGNQIVIDVGVNFDQAGNMVGDADFDAIKDKVRAVTPVPGGVGSVTTALLMYHVAMAAKAQSQEEN